MYRCVLFDLDNTLLIRRPSITEKIYEALSQDYPGICLEDVQKAYADSELWQGEQIRKENETGERMNDSDFFANVVTVYRKVLKLTENASDAVLEIVTGKYERTYTTVVGVFDVLEALKKSNVKLGIVSNNYTNVRNVLSNLELTPYFDSIIISEEAGIYKPDPKILELACNELGVSCCDSIYVGDHPFDILCAHSANMPVIWCPPNAFFRIPEYIGYPEYTISNFAELLEILVE